ncbi:MAG: HD domain-containing protein [Acholeplasmatales bacterium]|nr:HD domain-containing protein [Acholeplasmatales bacterium]
MDKEAVIRESNKKASLYNIYAILVVLSLLVVIEIANEIGLFEIPKIVMRPTVGISAVIFLVPICIFIIHDKILKKENSILETNLFKFIIITVAYVGLTLMAITLSYHAVLLLVVPPIMAAQYRNKKTTLILLLVATTLSVPFIIYGSFFFGYADRNLLKEILTDDELTDLSIRVEMVKDNPKRMLELFTHHVLPRWISIILIDVLVSGITQRNAEMLDKQKELSDQVTHEMERRTQMQNRVIEDLAAVIETRDVGTGEHVIRTKKYVGMIAREMQKYPKYKNILTNKYIKQIENSAPLHDVGKIAVRDAILLKPGRLTPEEFDEMKKHSAKGGEMINNIFSNLDDDEFFKIAYDIAVSHHEKWDGTGYPNGLKGEDIPLSGRIMAIADVYDALTSKRVYKDSMPPKKAFDIIVEGRGTHFDPDIIDIVITIKDKFISYVNEARKRLGELQ